MLNRLNFLTSLSQEKAQLITHTEENSTKNCTEFSITLHYLKPFHLEATAASIRGSCTSNVLALSVLMITSTP